MILSNIYISFTTKGCWCLLAVAMFSGATGALAQSGHPGNHVLTTTVQVPGVTESTVNGLPAEKGQRQIQYFDGLGRSLQTIQIQGGPGPERGDVVQPVEYDAFGREVNTFLPYVAPGSGGSYQPNAVGTDGSYTASDHFGFYNQRSNDNVAQDLKPYAARVFEPSPLNRVVEQGAPGEVWQPGTNGSVKTSYETNRAGEVIDFQYEPATGALTWHSERQPRYYPPTRLFVSRMTDEHGSDELTYTDKDERVLLKRKQYGGTGSAALYADTYYIYDAAGSLMYVLPPEAIKQLLKSIE